MGDGGSYNDCKGAGIDGRARLIRGADAPLGKHRKRESADELRHELQVRAVDLSPFVRVAGKGGAHNVSTGLLRGDSVGEAARVGHDQCAGSIMNGLDRLFEAEPVRARPARAVDRDNFGSRGDDSERVFKSRRDEDAAAAHLPESDLGQAHCFVYQSDVIESLCADPDRPTRGGRLGDERHCPGVAQRFTRVRLARDDESTA